MRRRPGSWIAPFAAALAIVVGCDDEPEPAPAAPSPAPAPAPTPTPAPAPVAPAPVAQKDDPGEPLDDVAQPRDQPEGVPFAFPEPLPPEARPRVIAGAAPPAPGPAPLAFWVGGTGVEDGRLSYPRAIAVEPDGAALIVDKTGRIQRFAADGRLLCVVRSPMIGNGKPTGIAVDAQGQVLVADTHYARVLVYGPDLTFRRCYGAPGRPAGMFMFVSAVGESPRARHWVADYGDDVARVQEFAHDGAYLRGVGTFGEGEGQFRRPMGLAFSDQELFVADAVNHRIVVLSLEDGRWLRALGGPGRAPGQLDFPYEVAHDGEGRLWIAEFGNQRVSVLDAEDGRCVATWGEPGRRLGCLARPWALALAPEGRLWILDSNNDRAYALERRVVLDAASGAAR